MSLTPRELITALHGMLLGGGFLLAFTGSAAAVWSLRTEWLRPAAVAPAVRRMLLGTWSMAILAWMTVLVGTFTVYPWYRAAPPAGAVASKVGYPKAILVSNPATKGWHEFGMEWKEHVGWLAPLLATAVAVVATRYRGGLADRPVVRKGMLALLSAAFFAAAAAGLLGALINKVAPVQ
jgi:hypothetical protein